MDKEVLLEDFKILNEEIFNLNIDSDKKSIIQDKIKNIEIKYNRLKKSSNMQIAELNQEKEILLNNFIKKDNDTNYLYNENIKLQKELERKKASEKILEKISCKLSKKIKKRTVK